MDSNQITPSWQMDSIQKAKVENEVKLFNRQLNNGKGLTQELGKDAFLKILVEQLKHQDPANPMKDQQFIAQMAQFNSLEQMMQMNKNTQLIAENLNQNGMTALLGKNVTIDDGMDKDGNVLQVIGKVTSITRDGGSPTVTVNKKIYSTNKIISISESE